MNLQAAYMTKLFCCGFIGLIGLGISNLAIAQIVGEDESLARLHDTPTAMFGVQCSKSQFRGMTAAVCLPGLDRAAPLTQIMVNHVKKEWDQTALFNEMQETMKVSGLKKVVVQEQWKIPNQANYIAARGIYKTSRGTQFLWLVVHEKHLFYVRIEPRRKAKFETLEPEVIAKIFSPEKFKATEAQATK